MFRHGAMVIPGEATYDLNYYAVKLTSFTGTLSNFKDNTLTGGTSGVVADVVNFVATDGTDPDTLFVKYRNSGTDNASDKFDFHFKTENLKLIEGDYDVAISSKNISHFKHKSKEIQYWIALEQTSTFN